MSPKKLFRLVAKKSDVSVHEEVYIPDILGMSRREWYDQSELEQESLLNRALLTWSLAVMKVDDISYESIH